MNEIETLIDRVEKYSNVIVQKKYYSKKNTVAYVIFNNKQVIIKWFAPVFKKNIENEFFILRNLPSSVNTPNVIEKDDDNNVLIMSHIFGKNLCDVINDESILINTKQKLVMDLANWFYKFHNHFNVNNNFRTRGDSTLRNFILTDRIWGVDFEEARPGRPVEDLACACASILTTNQMFTKEKFNLCKLLLEHYNELAPGRITNANNEIAYALLEKIQWRSVDEEILRKYSKKIKESGLS